MSDHDAKVINDVFLVILDYRIDDAQRYLDEYEDTPCTSFETVRAHEGMVRWYRTYIAALKKLRQLTTPRTTMRILTGQTTYLGATDNESTGESDSSQCDEDEPARDEQD